MPAVEHELKCIGKLKEWLDSIDVVELDAGKLGHDLERWLHQLKLKALLKDLAKNSMATAKNERLKDWKSSCYSCILAMLSRFVDKETGGCNVGREYFRPIMQASLRWMDRA